MPEIDDRATHHMTFMESRKYSNRRLTKPAAIAPTSTCGQIRGIHAMNSMSRPRQLQFAGQDVQTKPQNAEENEDAVEMKPKRGTGG